MAHEVVSLGADGGVGTEMHGFVGRACLKAAAEIACELEALGIITDVAGLSMKDTGCPAVTAQAATLKATEGQ